MFNCQRFKKFDNRLFGHLLYLSVTARTPRKGLNPFFKIKPVNHFLQLFAGLLISYIVSVGYASVF
jgi:hypothetical protein